MPARPSRTRRLPRCTRSNKLGTRGSSGSASPSSHQFTAPSLVYPTLSCGISLKHSSYVEVFGHTSDPSAGPIFVTVTWDSGQPYGTGTATANHSSHHWSTNIHGTHNQPGTTYTATATQDGSTTTCTARRPGHHHHHHHHHDHDHEHNYG